MKDSRTSRQKKATLISLVLSIAVIASLSPALGQSAQEDPLLKTYQQIIENYPRELEEIRQKGPEAKPQEMNILLNAGIAYQYLKKYQEALEVYQQALNLARQLKNGDSEIGILSLMATTHSKLGDDNGIEFYNRQLQETQQAGQKESQQNVMYLLGTAYLTSGDYLRAFDVAKSHNLLALETKNIDSESKALTNLILAYLATQNYDKALVSAEKLLEIGKNTTNQKITKQIALSYLNTIYQLKEQPEKALAICQQLLEIAKATNYPQEEISALQQLAFNYAEAGNLQQSIETLEKVLELSKTTKNLFSQSQALENLSQIYLELKNYSKAAELQNQSLVLYREYDKNPTSSNLAMGLFNLGNIALKTKQYSEAEKHLKQALSIRENFKKEILNNQSFFITSQDELNIFTNFLDIGIYRSLQQALVGQNKIEEALEIAEKGRARAMVSLLINRLGTKTALTENQGLISETINAPNLAKMQEIAKTHQTTLVQYSVMYENNNFYSSIRVNSNKKRETELYIWVIKPTGEIGFRQVDLTKLETRENRGNIQKTPLEALVNNSRESIGVRGRGIAVAPRNETINDGVETQKLQQLYKILIEPIAEFLPNNPEERVTFIPQDALFLVPFAALIDSKRNYLIDKHTILNTPSIQLLDLTTKQKQQSGKTAKDILVIGNPNMPSIRYDLEGEPQQLPALPGSEKEAQEIAALFNTQAITGSQATEQKIVEKMPSSRIIHLATHGLLDEMLGFQSSLAFTPADKEDGLLTTREILRLKLKADLVVLSACDTGRGSINGDGVIGLSRSFIGAGVPSVIVSLWAVPDNPTAFLMTEFYQTFQQTNDKAKALRQAMLKTKQKYPQPKDWAAFTLIGEAE